MKKFFKKPIPKKPNKSNLEIFKGQDFIESLTSKLGIMFTTPEYEIISQDEPGNAMYFIMQGDCIVSMIDYDNIRHECLKVLVVSDYFGEISYLHKCPRTCSVISRNYNTMARLSHDRLRMVFNQFPSFQVDLLA